MDKGELIKIARQALIDIRPQALYTSSYGCVTATGEVHNALNEACHAGTASFVFRNKGVILYTITTGSCMVRQKPVPDDIKLRYFEWLCSPASPWADCLDNGLNTSPEFVAKYGLILTDLDKHGKNLVTAALAASRAWYEHHLHIKMWDKLVQDGVHPRWAFFVAGCVTCSGDKVVYGMRSNVNHWPLWPMSASELYIRNFLTQTVKFDALPFAATGYGTSVGGAWGPMGEMQTSKWGASCYGTSEYWDDLKKKVKFAFEQDPGEFERTERGDYKNFLEIIKQEQERLYA